MTTPPLFVSKSREARSAFVTVPHRRHQPTLVAGAEAKNMSARIRLAYTFHTAAARAHARLAVYLASAYTTTLYGYTLTGAPASQLPMHTPHAGVLEPAFSRLSWHVFMEAGTAQCA